MAALRKGKRLLCERVEGGGASGCGGDAGGGSRWQNMQGSEL